MTALVGTAVVAFKTLTLILGGAITLFAYRATRRTGSSALRALTLGFGIVTLGALFAGIADQVLRLNADTALVIESAFTTVGFAIILYSLFVKEPAVRHKEPS